MLAAGFDERFLDGTSNEVAEEQPATAEEIFTQRERDAYFGAGARRRFFALYNTVQDSMASLHAPETGGDTALDGEYAGLSERGIEFAAPDDPFDDADPDARALEEEAAWLGPGRAHAAQQLPAPGQPQRAARAGLLPLPSLVRRMSAQKSIVLRGLGVGDGIVSALTRVLPELPHVSELVLPDNRLTDASLVPLCEPASCTCRGS